MTRVQRLRACALPGGAAYGLRSLFSAWGLSKCPKSKFSNIHHVERSALIYCELVFIRRRRGN